jgi:RNA polymerase sigma factor (sigma-70 family)
MGRRAGWNGGNAPMGEDEKEIYGIFVEHIRAAGEDKGPLFDALDSESKKFYYVNVTVLDLLGEVLTRGCGRWCGHYRKVKKESPAERNEDIVIKYARTIAHNWLVDVMRKERTCKNNKKAVAYEKQARTPAASSPLEHMIRADEIEELKRNIASLSMSQKELVDLYLSGKTLREIARITGRTYEAIKTEMSRIRQTLRKARGSEEE